MSETASATTVHAPAKLAHRRIGLFVLGLTVSCWLSYAGVLLFINHNPPSRSPFLFLVIGCFVLSACTCFVRGLLVPHERLAWLGFGFGILAWAGGEFMYDFVLPLVNPPFPSCADASYLCFYPLMCLATCRLVGSRLPGILRSGTWLNALIAILAALAISVLLLFNPLANTLSGTTAAIAINLAYPISDLAMLLVLITACALSGWRLERSLFLIFIGLILWWIADTVYLIQTADGIRQGDGLVLLPWPLGACLIAGAAWLRPAVIAFAHRTRKEGLSAQVICAAAMAGILFYGTFEHINPLARYLAILTLICVFLRMWQVFKNAQSVAQQMTTVSLTDPLTNLGNRRQLIQDLEHAIATLERTTETEAFQLAFAIFDLNGFKSYNDTFGHPAGDELLRRLADKLGEAVSGWGSAYRLGGDEFCILVPADEHLTTHIEGNIIDALGEHGKGYNIDAAYGFAILLDEAHTVADVMGLADRRMYEQKASRRPSLGSQMRSVLVSTLTERDQTLGEHNDDVAELTKMTAQRLGLSKDEVEEAIQAAELHDIGKVAVPDSILFKSGKLTEDEWETMRLHTIVGERILCASPELAVVGRIVRSSHERWDGNGYPDRLTAETIPLGSRIVAVCDAYDAMTSDRPYHTGISQTDALAELEKCSGTQFDPQVVSAFLACMATVRKSAIDSAIKQPIDFAAV